MMRHMVCPRFNFLVVANFTLAPFNAVFEIHHWTPFVSWNLDKKEPPGIHKSNRQTFWYLNVTITRPKLDGVFVHARDRPESNCSSHRADTTHKYIFMAVYLGKRQIAMYSLRSNRYFSRFYNFAGSCKQIFRECDQFQQSSYRAIGFDPVEDWNRIINSCAPMSIIISIRPASFFAIAVVRGAVMCCRFQFGHFIEPIHLA